jgi:hypothetical protein
VPTGVPGSGRGAKANGKRPRRKVKRRGREEGTFITPDLTRAETKLLYKSIRSLPRTQVSAREGATVLSLLSKVTEAVISRD